jgi:hypothetical protein
LLRRFLAAVFAELETSHETSPDEPDEPDDPDDLPPRSARLLTGSVLCSRASAPVAGERFFLDPPTAAARRSLPLAASS